MKKSFLPVLFLVFGVAAASYLAGELHRAQLRINRSRVLTSRTPVAGFQKLLSDLQWIQFIQYCGTAHRIDESNIEEVFQRADRLLSLDPDFTKVYEAGAMMLYVEEPDLAMRILDRALENPNLSTNWELPFLAGFIAVRYEPEDESVRRRWLQRSLGYFQMAYERNAGRTPYVLNHLIRTRAELDDERPFAMAELKAWYTFYQDQKYRQAQEDPFEDQSDVLKKLIASGQRCREELHDHPEARALTDRILSELQEQHHLCYACFSHYQAGDRFCRSCGEGVKPYGICSGCGHHREGRDAFCPRCGQRQRR